MKQTIILFLILIVFVSLSYGNETYCWQVKTTEGKIFNTSVFFNVDTSEGHLSCIVDGIETMVPQKVIKSIIVDRIENRVAIGTIESIDGIKAEFRLGTISKITTRSAFGRGKTQIDKISTVQKCK